MNVGELKNLIEDYNDDVEVRLMTQPNYPFQYSIDDVVDLNEIRIRQGHDMDGEENILYLTEGEQIEYGSKKAWE